MFRKLRAFFKALFGFAGDAAESLVADDNFAVRTTTHEDLDAWCVDAKFEPSGTAPTVTLTERKSVKVNVAKSARKAKKTSAKAKNSVKAPARKKKSAKKITRKKSR